MHPNPTMTAAVADAPGVPLRLRAAPTPEPGPGEVLIRVLSAGVNFSDVKRARGDLYPFPTAFPFVPGSEVAGEIVAHGPGGEGPPVGTRVFALARGGSGGYAQYAVASARHAIPVPPGLALDAASAILVAGTTAALIVSEVARIAAGEVVYVPSAAGGVGAYAVQLAVRRGAKVIAGVGSPAKVDAARAHGAHAVIVTAGADVPDRVREHAPGGVDVALEAAGGPALEVGLACLAPFGRLVVYGAASGRSATLSPGALDAWLYAPALCQQVTVFNLGVWFGVRPDAAGAALSTLIGQIARGEIAVPPIAAAPLAEAAGVQERLAARATTGKLVLKPWPGGE